MNQNNEPTQNNEPLTDTQLEEFKKRLVEERLYTTDKIETLRAQFSDHQDNPTEEGDQAALEMERTDLRNQISRYIKKEATIINVINNFDEDFGFCVDCGCDMDIRRLNADPTFSRCIECEEVRERKSQLYAQR